MRMWMTNPKLMCRKHLLGEHVETHMLVGSINKKKSLDGFIYKGLIEPQNLKKRHKELANEMLRRGYNHDSPLPKFKTDLEGEVDVSQSVEDLIDRCEECKKLWLNSYHA